MPELGKRIGVNKSTIQRYEADGVAPKRTMIINGLAEELLTTPEWLTGLSDDREYSIYTVCQLDLEKHIKGYLETVTNTVNGEPHQQLLTTFLGQIVDLYTILTKYWAVSMKKVDEVAEDEGLKESIGKYAIHIGSITEQVYQKEMEVPIEDMKRYLDGILHLYDEGRTKVSIPELFGIVDQAKQKLIEKGTLVPGHLEIRIRERKKPVIKTGGYGNTHTICHRPDCHGYGKENYDLWQKDLSERKAKSGTTASTWKTRAEIWCRRNTPERKASPRLKPCSARQWKTTRQRSLSQSLKTSRWAICWIYGLRKKSSPAISPTVR